VVVQVKALACKLPFRRGIPLFRFSTSEISIEAIQREIVAKISGAIVFRRDDMKTLLRIFFIFFLLLSSAQAKVKYIPIEKMPAMADFIVIGTVIHSTSRWDERGIMIFTDYTIQVEEKILSDVPSTISMSFAGGTVGDKTITVTDTPILKIGEKYALFGYNNNKYSLPVVGHEQGVFRVAHDRLKNVDFLVDYNDYQLEITKEGEMIRGPLTEVDAQGALIIRRIEENGLTNRVYSEITPNDPDTPVQTARRK